MLYNGPLQVRGEGAISSHFKNEREHVSPVIDLSTPMHTGPQDLYKIYDVQYSFGLTEKRFYEK